MRLRLVRELLEPYAVDMHGVEPWEELPGDESLDNRVLEDDRRVVRLVLLALPKLRLLVLVCGLVSAQLRDGGFAKSERGPVEGRMWRTGV